MVSSDKHPDLSPVLSGMTELRTQNMSALLVAEIDRDNIKTSQFAVIV